MKWHPRSWHAPLVRAASNGLLRAVTHLLVLVGGYEVYRAISVNAPHPPALAHAHAAVLIDLERRLGLFIEPRAQYAALHHAASLSFGLLDGASVRHLATLVYAGSHLHWLAAMLLWLYLFQRHRFTAVRNLVVATTLLAVVFSALYAVAPPRFALAGVPYGIEDVLHPHQPEALLVQQAAFDPYSSLPSSHTLWALLTGLGLFLGATTLPRRLLAAAFPLVIMLVVVITGNHYVLDCVGSAALLIACMAIGWLLRRRFPYGLLAHRQVDGPVPDRPRPERRHNPNLRPLDRPLILCATVATLLLVSTDTAQRLIGLGLLLCAAIMPPLARYRILAGIPLRADAVAADWWCGFFFIAGGTTIGAGDPTARLYGSLLWLAAALLPLVARLRTEAGNTAPSRFRIQRRYPSWSSMLP